MQIFSRYLISGNAGKAQRRVQALVNGISLERTRRRRETLGSATRLDLPSGFIDCRAIHFVQAGSFVEGSINRDAVVATGREDLNIIPGQGGLCSAEGDFYRQG